jgi:hypothetical protein
MVLKHLNITIKHLSKTTYCSTNIFSTVRPRNNELNCLLQDLIHHYDTDSPTSKLESHIYAIVLLLCLQKHYISDLSWEEETVSEVSVTFIFRVFLFMYTVIALIFQQGLISIL